VVLVLRFPRSWNLPHRVTARNTSRFYGRNSAGAYELSVDELRALFGAGATAAELIRAFRTERVAKIAAGEGPIRMAPETNRLVVHVVPFSAFVTKANVVDLERAMEFQEKLRPIGSAGWSPRINFDGLINVRSGSPPHGYTQLFRTGIIESVKVGVVGEHDGKRFLPTTRFEGDVVAALPLYFDALQRLDVQPPFVVMLTLDGVRDVVLGIGPFAEPEPFDRTLLALPEVLVADYGSAEDYQRAIRPALDSVWNAGGYTGSPNFDENGVWAERRR
jgi:hypothetical protein